MFLNNLNASYEYNIYFFLERNHLIHFLKVNNKYLRFLNKINKSIVLFGDVTIYHTKQ